MKTRKVLSMNDFANMIHELLRSNRDVIIGTSGMTGEGKSTFSIKLQKKYSEIAGVPWSLKHNLTASRHSLMTWINGEPGSVADEVTGLKPGQKPMYSALLADELILMFYNRKWSDNEQINAIGDLNLFRSRRLLLCGNVPRFWRLDSAFLERVRYYVFVPKRGTAWVFQQENNPFTDDPWNRKVNSRLVAENGNPYKSDNFIGEIIFGDLSGDEKLEYEELRANLQLQDKKEAVEDDKFAHRLAIGYFALSTGLSSRDLAVEFPIFGASTYFRYMKLAEKDKALKG